MNYKPHHQTINFGGRQTMLNSDAKIKVLTYMGTQSTGGVSMHDSIGGADYQVPVSKKFVFLGARCIGHATVGLTVKIIDSDTADSSDADTTFAIYEIPPLTFNTHATDYPAPEISGTAPASNYINVVINGVSGLSMCFYIIGYETNE